MDQTGTDARESDLQAAWAELAPHEQCLRLSKQIGEIVVAIDDVLLLLRGKRATLEEKMIARYFHQLIEHYARLAGRIHYALAKADDKSLPDSLARDGLFDVNMRAKATVDELLKIASYNFNFLEQYFEHDYFESLVEKHKFIEALDSLLKRFP
jgi:hypothetical protein